MSSLGDLLMAHLKPNKTEKVSDLESCDDINNIKERETIQETTKTSLSPTKDHPSPSSRLIQNPELTDNDRYLESPIATLDKQNVDRDMPGASCHERGSGIEKSRSRSRSPTKSQSRRHHKSSSRSHHSHHRKHSSRDRSKRSSKRSRRSRSRSGESKHRHESRGGDRHHSRKSHHDKELVEDKTKNEQLAHSHEDLEAEESSHNEELASAKVFPERIEKNKVDDVQSNASSTDDYVRELLDPDDRPRNVWHVVEGPKQQPDNDIELEENNAQAAPLDDDLPMHNPENSIQSKEEPGFEPADRSEIESSNGAEFDNLQNVNALIDDNDKRYDEKKSDKLEEKSRSKRGRSRERSSSSRRHRHDRVRNEIDRDRRKSRRRYDISDAEGEDANDSRRRNSRRDRRNSRSKSKTSSRRRDRSRSDSQSPITKRNSRTILIMQLSPRVNSRDLEDFFSDIGRVREVRLIMDSKTRRHKGIAYIEFEEASTAAKAFSLNGQKFFGAPVVIQSAQMDRNGPSGDWHTSTSLSVNHPSSHPSSRSHLPPDCYRVYVGGLHVNLTEEMIRSVFEPFGPIVRLELMKDRATNVSRGYAFITYANIEDGQKAVQALDGFELGGKALRVSKSTDKSERYPGTEVTGSSAGRGAHRHDSDSDGRSSRSKDVTASLYELAGH